MQKPLVKSCNYFPDIEWFRAYRNAELCFIPVFRSYQRRSMENRCVIGSAQGPLVLSVPLEGGRNQHRCLKDIHIAYHTRWQHQHAQAIRSAYGRAPFFEHYYSLFKPMFTQSFPSLVQLNLFILDQSLKALRITPKHQVLYDAHPALIEEPLETVLPTTANTTKSYIQPFSDRHPFMPNLSILDLLFCCGPASTQYL